MHNQSRSPLQLPPLSLYVHIPWCVKKCPYCDFNSHVAGQTLPETEYVSALLRDLDFQLDHAQGRSLHSIFIGGGTPSLFSAKAIAELLTGIELRIPFEQGIEITLEANPGTVEQNKFVGFYVAGVNRLSIGVQSFNDQHLKNLGRIHGRHEAINAAATAINAGFTNFNIDLMHGLSGQNDEQALTDLKQAIQLGATHISWYQLTIEPNTVFFNTPPTIPDDDQLADIQSAGESLLASQGFAQYEVSAYSTNQQASRHNMNYWTFGDYIGIGAGAHGKITDLNKLSITRQWQTRNPKDYLAKGHDFSAGQKTIATDDIPLEFMMNALRLNQPLHLDLFHQRTGLSLAIIEPNLQQLANKGLLEYSKQHITTTSLGRRFLNELLAEF